MEPAEAATPASAREFLAALADRDQVRLAMKDGSVIEGSFLQQAGMHFVHCRDGSTIGHVAGPIDADEIASFSLVKPRADVIAEIHERRTGIPVPGTLRRTRDGYQARLEALAGACAREPAFRRRMEIEAQFDDVADEIGLARTKRNWMLGEARWRLRSNREPDKMDMCGGDMTSAERLKRPRPQDFDPDPAERRRRPVLPEHVSGDPLSPPNMLKALRQAGFRARVSVVSEMTHDGVDLLVDFPGGKREGRFVVSGKRTDGSMSWRAIWEGGQSAAARTRQARCLRSEGYATLERVLRAGLAVSVACTRPAAADEADPQGEVLCGGPARR